MINCKHWEGGQPVATFDCEGLIFAAYAMDSTICLFDVREYSNVRLKRVVFQAGQGPFAKFSLQDPDIVSKIQPKLTDHGIRSEQLYPTSLSFSPDGKFLLVMTNISVCLQLDAFEGTLVRTMCVSRAYS